MIDKWDNFLLNEKLDPKKLELRDVMTLIRLCELLAANRGPLISSYQLKQESREYVCNVAMENGIDLTSMKHMFKGKMLMGRGLLDVWLKVYAERYGDTFGTLAEREAIRRNVKTKLAQERKVDSNANL